MFELPNILEINNFETEGNQNICNTGSGPKNQCNSGSGSNTNQCMDGSGSNKNSCKNGSK
jgi:hypothetical protein